MFIVGSYTLAVIFCFITMLCWGSWGNTQKLAAKSWRYELFYWDYVIGMVLFSLVLAFTAGSIGEEGRPFLQDLGQASWESIGWVLLGALVFNVSNILLSASTSIAGLAVAFPLGVGIALVMGVLNNLLLHPTDGQNTTLLWVGVALVVLAVICNGIASGKVSNEQRDPKQNRKGIILAVLAGLIMSFFSALVYNGVDLDNFAAPAAGKLTPYTAMVIFALGVFLSNFVVNTIVMKKPFVGEPVTYKQYFAGNMKTHLVGVLGGVIWALGTSLNYISAGKAGAAVSYALGQGAPMIAAIWGVFIWKEFKGARKGVYGLLALMFALFVAGLACVVVAGK
ncbi:MAG: multidrug DMT transporter permease [Bacteroidales bacterium]|nr:multidrug DMT transporter permease [Bacteroidales bacterium]MBQ2544359.1 multidrug DMT transporter permease [Bacteroidales bacterium]